MTEAVIESLDHEGLGVAHVDGKVTFIEGGVTGERVLFARRKSRGKFDVGMVTEVLSASALRTSPRCAYFGMCGGCAMQHVDPVAQVAAKRRLIVPIASRSGRARVKYCLIPFRHLVNHLIRINNLD